MLSGANQTRTARSDAAGFYRFAEVPPGNYSLAADASGFKRVEIQNIVLQVSQTARLDVVVTVGQSSEVVQVVGGAPLLESETSSVGHVIESHQIADIPLNG